MRVANVSWVMVLQGMTRSYLCARSGDVSIPRLNDMVNGIDANQIG